MLTPTPTPTPTPPSTPVVAELDASWAPAWLNLVGYWKLDDSANSGTALDSSVGGLNSGLVMGGVTQGVPGKIKTAASFDGSSGYFKIQDSSSLEVTNAASFSMWFNASALSDRRILDKQVSGTSNTGYSFDTYNSHLRFCGACGCYSSTATLSTGVWYHGAMTFNNGTLNFYLNGQLDSTQATGCSSIGTSSNPLDIGFAASGGQAWNYFSGIIDDVAIWNTALTSAEMTTIYQRESALTVTNPVPSPTPSSSPTPMPTPTPTTFIGPLPSPTPTATPRPSPTPTSTGTGANPNPTPSVATTLGPVGTLLEPYGSALQANVPFGVMSYYLQPWKSYLDTWPAQRMLDAPGMNWTFINYNDIHADATANLLSQSGIRSVRIETDWGDLGFDDQYTAQNLQKYTYLLQMFKKYGIRPLMLMNANSYVPCPFRPVTVNVIGGGAKGSYSVQVSDASQVRIGYTGIDNGEVRAASLVTAISPNGTLSLSSPLGGAIPLGSLTMTDLKYQPFDGPNSDDTYAGWVKFASAVGNMAQAALGTQGQDDPGFDIEVWNELGFASNFVAYNNYFTTPQPIHSFTYTKNRPLLPTYRPNAKTVFTSSGYQSILPMTVDWFNNPANGFAGASGISKVNVISGFSNEEPWESGTNQWDKQAGFSRHYYTGGPVLASTLTATNWGPINALGIVDGTRTPADIASIVPGTDFVPNMSLALPEWRYMGFQTESAVRDLIPDSRLSNILGTAHGRFTQNGDFQNSQVWMTETNFDRDTFIGGVQSQLSNPNPSPYIDARLDLLDRHMAGKMLLRNYIFATHAGLKKLFLFEIGQAAPGSFEQLPHEFEDALDANGEQLTQQAWNTVPEYRGMAWLTSLLSTSQPVQVTRPLDVASITEYNQQTVISGNGTAADPDTHNRDYFAFLPFQMSASEFAIPYYVATLDVTHSYNSSYDITNPARYDMPEQYFDVTVNNLRGTGAAVNAYDPLTNVSVPVQVIASSANSVTLRLIAVDYPRFLHFKESQDGLQILNPNVVTDSSGNLTVSFTTNYPLTSGTITYGPDWEYRGSTPVTLTPGQTSYSVQIPTHYSGTVIAVRIIANANSLSNVWPKYDEDPQGQVVVGGAGLTLAEVNGLPSGSVNLQTGQSPYFCAGIYNGYTAAGISLVQYACSSSYESQDFHFRADTGEIRVYNDTFCVNDYGGQGLVGDNLDIWFCNGSAAQKFTFNSVPGNSSLGTITGSTGLCIDQNGTPGNNIQLVLKACNGSTMQQWSKQTAPTPDPITSLTSP
jgi:hypothetical protein